MRLVKKCGWELGEPHAHTHTMEKKIQLEKPPPGSLLYNRISGWVTDRTDERPRRSHAGTFVPALRPRLLSLRICIGFWNPKLSKEFYVTLHVKWKTFPTELKERLICSLIKDRDQAQFKFYLWDTVHIRKRNNKMSIY